MTLQGIIIIDIVALLFMAGVLLLLRAGMIYAGYAALWICSTLGVAVLVSVPPLLAGFTSAVGAIFPVSALTLLAFIFIVVVLVLFSIKLTQLHERQTAIIQVLSLRALDEKERQTSAESDASRIPDAR
jgi:hypothetical protein